MNLQIISDIKHLAPLVSDLSDLSPEDVIGFDTETSSLDWLTCKLYTVQLYIKGNTYVVDCLQFKELKYLMELISGKTLVGHNIKYDIKVILAQTGVHLNKVYDTMLAEILINQGIGDKFYSLKDLVYQYTGNQLDKEVRASFYELGDLDFLTNEQLMYAGEDVNYLPTIRDAQLKKLESQNQMKVANLEMELTAVVAYMEHEGVYLDKEMWTELMNSALLKAKEVENQLIDLIIRRLAYENYTSLELFEALAIPVKTKRMRDQIESLRPEYVKESLKGYINISSPKQMLAILNNLGINVESTSEKVLKECGIDDEVISLILLYREFEKKGTTFGQNFLDRVHPITGRVHSEFNQLMADTGRFSSSKPNLQQIVRDSDYRHCFRARPGYKIVTADYSQQELRLAGNITGEQKFIEAFLNGIDLHTLTASILYDVPIDKVEKWQRQIAKSYNFAVLYGSTEYGLAYNFQIDLKVAKELLNKFYKGYPRLAAFKSAIEEAIYKASYSSTPYGRKRYFAKKGFYSDSKERSKEMNSIMRQGFNHIIQGAGADITKLALVRIFNTNPYGDKLKILMPVHDEIVCEVAEDIADEAAKFIVDCMKEVEQPFLGKIPAEVGYSIDNTWSK